MCGTRSIPSEMPRRREGTGPKRYWYAMRYPDYLSARGLIRVHLAAHPYVSAILSILLQKWSTETKTALQALSRSAGGSAVTNRSRSE